MSIGLATLALTMGCTPKRKVTDHDRKEAAHLASEAEFAISIREWARAEGLLAKAVQVAPHGDYWLSLGVARVRQGNRAGAKDAYLAALKAYENLTAIDNTHADPWLKQAYVLALLGRKEDSRAVIANAAKRFPNDMKVRLLTDTKEFEKMITAPTFKDMAL